MSGSESRMSYSNNQQWQKIPVILSELVGKERPLERNVGSERNLKSEGTLELVGKECRSLSLSVAVAALRRSGGSQ